MRCAECSTSNPLDHKYCKECGTPLDDGYRALLRQARAAELPEDTAKQEKITQLIDMAFWHNESGHLDAAVKACEAALSLHADNTTAHSLLGTIYEKKGDDAAAISHLERVVALNPDSAADALKLDQLTRGVHVRAAAPPPVHRWIPPALASLALTPRPPLPQAGEGEQTKRRPRWLALLGASCAAALVLGIGWTALRDNSAGTNPLSRPAVVSFDAENKSVNGAQSPSDTPLQGGLPPPVTLPPGQSSGRALSDIFPPPPYPQPQASTAPDPFAGRVPSYAAAVPLPTRTVRVPRAARIPGSSKVRPLPPLSLTAVPLPGEAIAPAPVQLPPDALPGVPQHTVVVRSLGGQDNAPPASSPSPHIRITVNSAAPSDGPIVLSGNGGQITTTYPAGQTADAARLQQSALSAQQNGNYKQARSWYEQAIRAYRAQIAAGRDADTARAGLSACQTGLSICQQNPL